MTCKLVPGQTSWSPLSVDAYGHRTYKIKFLVQSDDPKDGPATAFQTPGLPQPGSLWVFDNDEDVWAWCREECEVREVTSQEPNVHFTVEKTFSTKPPEFNQQRCNDTKIEDPILEPYKISGDFTRFTEEATHDRFGLPITNSAWEAIRGQQTEFDSSRGTIQIEQNVLDLQLPLLNAMRDTLNDSVLWGFPARCIKLSVQPWERKFYGQCYVYYTRKLTFETNVKQSVDDSGNPLFNPDGSPLLESGWDKNILDEGDKALNGHWGIASKGETEGKWYLDNIAGKPPDRMNPAHFKRLLDAEGHPTHFILDGFGVPVQQGDTTYHLSSILIANPGGGYKVGDTITLAGGTFSQAVILTVTALTPPQADGHQAGIIKSIGITNRGTYTAKPGNPVSQGSTSGAGVGATFTITWSVPGITTTPGSIHVEKYGESNFLLLDVPLILV